MTKESVHPTTLRKAVALIRGCAIRALQDARTERRLATTNLTGIYVNYSIKNVLRKLARIVVVDDVSSVLNSYNLVLVRSWDHLVFIPCHVAVSDIFHK